MTKANSPQRCTSGSETVGEFGARVRVRAHIKGNLLKRALMLKGKNVALFWYGKHYFHKRMYTILIRHVRNYVIGVTHMGRGYWLLNNHAPIGVAPIAYSPN